MKLSHDTKSALPREKWGRVLFHASVAATFLRSALAAMEILLLDESPR